MNATTFVLLSFEGPDRYAHAGGLGSRVSELSSSLADLGFETHLFFIGDPDLPPIERRADGCLVLHRWCQWISRFHAAGVYDGEEGKVEDWTASIPPWLERELLAPKVAAGESIVIMAEEWHTAGSVIALGEVIARRGWKSQVQVLWNLNNAFGAHRIDWRALAGTAVITTVSRYMKHFMWAYGVNARVIPNGIGEGWLDAPDREASTALKRLVADRLTLAKVARWDPDKRWNMAIDAVAEMKLRGLRPLLLARGGIGAHRSEVLGRAADRGLGVASADWDGAEPAQLVEALAPVVSADVVDLQGYLRQPQLKALYRTVDVVLANSGIEPFGLVGLEAMASGGVAFVGCTGEDYATPGYDTVCLHTDSALEVLHYAVWLRTSQAAARRIRQAAQQTAKLHTWRTVLKRALLPVVEESSGIVPVPAWPTPPEPGKGDLWDETERPQAPPQWETGVLVAQSV